MPTSSSPQVLGKINKLIPIEFKKVRYPTRVNEEPCHYLVKQHLPSIHKSIAESTSKEADSSSPSMQHREGDDVESSKESNKENDDMEPTCHTLAINSKSMHVEGEN